MSRTQCFFDKVCYPLRQEGNRLAGNARFEGASILLSSNELDRIRYNPQEREAFLARLAQRHDAAIVRTVTRAGGPEYLNLIDEARQAFLIRANTALDSAREQDDGRGRNDPAAWCAWCGMLAVKEIVRKKRGRYDRASIKQRAENQMLYAGDVRPNSRRARRSGGNYHDQNTISAEESIYFADPNDYAEEASANVYCAAFLDGLRGFDRDLAMLMVYGETETLALTCTCTGAVHSYIHDLACALNCNESRIFKGIRRLRDACRPGYAQ